MRIGEMKQPIQKTDLKHIKVFARSKCKHNYDQVKILTSGLLTEHNLHYLYNNRHVMTREN